MYFRACCPDHPTCPAPSTRCGADPRSAASTPCWNSGARDRTPPSACLATTDLASALLLDDELMFNLLLLSDLLCLPGHHFLVLVHQYHGEQLLKGD